MRYAFARQKDGHLKSVFYDESGYLQLNCLAKDFQDSEVTVIGQYHEPSAQDLINEIQ